MASRRAGDGGPYKRWEQINPPSRVDWMEDAALGHILLTLSDILWDIAGNRLAVSEPDDVEHTSRSVDSVPSEGQDGTSAVASPTCGD
jgi:hypothetical protein